MSEAKDTVNIFLNTEDKKQEILENVPAERKYIILQNDELHAKNKALVEESMELKGHNEELEEDNGRLEQRITNITGILKNFHAMNKLYKDLSEHEKTMFENSRKDFYDFRSRAKYHLRILESCLFTFLGVCYECYELGYFLPILVVIMCVVAFQESTMFNMPSLTCRKEEWIKSNSIKDEILKIEKAQDYIHEFLEQM